MSSFFYSTHPQDNLPTFPLPTSLNRTLVLQILHDESIMRRLVWLPGFEDAPPKSAQAPPAPLSWSEAFTSVVFPFSSAESQRMTRTLTALEDGVEVVHEMFALKITTAYQVIEDSSSKGPQLQTTGTVRFLKPLHRVLGGDSEREKPPIHVARVRCFLEELGSNGGDVAAAFASEALADVEQQYKPQERAESQPSGNDVHA